MDTSRRNDDPVGGIPRHRRGERGHLRCHRRRDADALDLGKTDNRLQQLVTEGSHVRTDGWSGFARLGEAGYSHEIIPNPPRLTNDCPFPVVHTFISNAKAWMLGTFHGLGPRYMAAYFAEFCWRFNRRRYSESLFTRLIKTCLWAPPAPAAVSTAA